MQLFFMLLVNVDSSLHQSQVTLSVPGRHVRPRRPSMQLVEKAGLSGAMLPAG